MTYKGWYAIKPKQTSKQIFQSPFKAFESVIFLPGLGSGFLSRNPREFCAFYTPRRILV